MDASDGSGLEGLSTTEALRTSALQQREKRLAELPISLAIQKYWEILKVSKKNELSKDEFTNLVHRLHKALLLRFVEPEEGPFTADEIWNKFVKGKSMKLEEFSDFLMELGDVWTMAGSPDEVGSFLLNLFHRIVTGPKKKSKKAKPPQTMLPRYLCELVLRGIGIEEVQDVLKTKIPKKGATGGGEAEGGEEEEEEGKLVVFPNEETPEELRQFLEAILKDEEALNIMIEKRKEILEKAEPLSAEASTLFLFPEEEKYVYAAVENIVGDFPPFDLSDPHANRYVDLMVFGQEEPIKSIFPSYERTEQLCRWIVGRRGMERRHKESLFVDQRDSVPSWEEHDDFLQHDAEQTFARRSPPAVLIVGKRYCGKSTLGKFVAEFLNVPYISAFDLIKEDPQCIKLLRQGGAASWKDVANLMHKRLSSRYIMSHGYVFDDLPCIVDGVNVVSKSDLRSFVSKSGLEDVFPPNVIIELGMSDQESTYRVESLRLDPKTGKIYSMYQLTFEPPKKTKKAKETEEEDGGEEEEGEQEEEEEEEEEQEEWEVEDAEGNMVEKEFDSKGRINPNIRKRCVPLDVENAATLSRMYVEPKDFIPDILVNVKSKKQFFSVEGACLPTDMFDSAKLLLRDLEPGQRAYTQEQFEDLRRAEAEAAEAKAEANGGDASEEEEEVPEPKNSVFGSMCTVCYREKAQQKSIEEAEESLSAIYRHQVYKFCCEECMKRFLDAPRCYVIGPNPTPSGLIVSVVGPPHIGKTRVSQSLAKELELEYVDLEDVVRKVESKNLFGNTALQTEVKKVLQSGKELPGPLLCKILRHVVRSEEERFFSSFSFSSNLHKAARGYVIDGFPTTRSHQQALAESNLSIGKYVLLKEAEKGEGEEKEEVNGEEEDDEDEDEDEQAKSAKRAALEKKKKEQEDKLSPQDIALKKRVDLWNREKEEFIGSIEEPLEVEMNEAANFDSVVSDVAKKLNPFSVRGEEVELEDEETTQWGDFGPYDSVEFQKTGLLYGGNKTIAVKYRDQNYAFLTEANRSEFLKMPDGYIPSDYSILPPPTVWLIGPHGSGKSSVITRTLASSGVPVVSMDRNWLISQSSREENAAWKKVASVVREENAEREQVARLKEDLRKKRKEERAAARKEAGEDGDGETEEEAEEEEAEEEEAEEEEDDGGDFVPNPLKPTPAYVWTARMFKALVSEEPYRSSGYILDSVPLDDRKALLQIVRNQRIHPEVILSVSLEESAAVKRLMNEEIERYKEKKEKDRKDKEEERKRAIAAGEDVEGEQEEEEEEADPTAAEDEMKEECESAIREKLSEENDKIPDIMTTIQEHCFAPVISVSGDPLPRVVSSVVKTAMQKHVFVRSSFLQDNTYQLLPVEKGLKMIRSGRKRMSKFGMRDPVIVNDMLKGSEWAPPVCALVHRHFVYFFAKDEHRAVFMKDPQTWARNTPSSARRRNLRVAVIGGPKCGKSTLAAGLSKKLGLALLTPRSLIDYVVNSHTSVGKDVDVMLKSGNSLRTIQWERVLNVVLPARTHLQTGYVLDGIPPQRTLTPGVDIVVCVDSPVSVCVKRSSDEMEVVGSRYEFERNKVLDVCRYYESLYCPSQVIHVSSAQQSSWATRNKVLPSLWQCMRSLNDANRVRCTWMLPVEAKMFEEKLSKFGHYCCVEFVDRGELVDTSSDPTRRYVVEVEIEKRWENAEIVRDVLYLCTSSQENMKLVLNDPSAYLDSEKTLPDILPKHVSIHDDEDKDSSEIALKGWCPVALAESPDISPEFAHGKPEWTCDYDGQRFQISEKDRFERFMRKPWEYAKTPLPAKIPVEPELGEGGIAKLPVPGYLQASVARVMGDALENVADYRGSIHPKLSANQSVIALIALEMYHNNPSISDVVRKRRGRKFEDFMKACSVVHDLVACPPVAPEFDALSQTFDQLKSENIGKYFFLQKDDEA
eukprot:TRINITY_DN158_c0_g1_i1.p1 TRINITY_DN158_c0_g1~~TRINITY_DN158_c0_g1_i1.p1  ORF type:complete len:1987 (+),score=667.33 TRINITY_DN158_c0_g1_i1:169-5961(+)